MTQAFVNLGVTQAMSPNIHSFVGDLVAMAQAMERVPQLETELSQVKLAYEGAINHNQALEVNIISYKQQIEDLHIKVRSLEVERDDASFRVLEAEDSATNVLNLVRVAQANLSVVIAKLDPPKPLPEPEKIETEVHPTVPLADWKQDQAETSMLPRSQSVTDPTPVSTVEGSHVASNVETQATAFSEEAPKSDANPIVKAEDTPSEIASSPSASSTVADTNACKGPYFGKRYDDYPAYVSFHDWLDGGGTEVGYYWRPEHKANF